MNDKNWNPATFLPDTIPGEGLLLLHADQLKALCFMFLFRSSGFYHHGFIRWDFGRFAATSTTVGLKIEKKILHTGEKMLKANKQCAGFHLWSLQSYVCLQKFSIVKKWHVKGNLNNFQTSLQKPALLLQGSKSTDNEAVRPTSYNAHR